MPKYHPPSLIYGIPGNSGEIGRKTGMRTVTQTRVKMRVQTRVQGSQGKAE